MTKPKIVQAEREFETASDELREAERIWLEAVDHDPVPLGPGSPADRLRGAIRNYHRKLRVLVELDLEEEEKNG